MKKFRLLLIALTFPIQVFAQSVVTDPGSYAYYIQQIAKTTQEIQEIQNAVSQMKEFNEGLSKMSNELSTIYNNTFGIVGEISYLVETVEKTPEYIKKGIKKVEAMANCVGDQVKSYKVLENMRQARYETSTPVESPWNYGSAPAKKGEYIKFGTDLSQGTLARPCGDHVPNYTDIMENKYPVFVVFKTHKKSINYNQTRYSKSYFFWRFVVSKHARIGF